MILDCARAKPGAFGALRLWICGFGVAVAAALAGCSANTKVYNGTPVVTVTGQATGDFSTYVVGISVYSMTRSDGYIAYPAGYTYEEFADLTQRVDLSELLNAVGLPTGSYTSVVIGIDYSSPIVYLKGATTPASVKDSGGTVDPGILYVTVKFDPSHPFVLSLNQSTPLALDFNLAASNTVDVSTNVVTVKPFVEAVSPSNDTEPVRARGLFVAANTGQSNFVEDLRPFEDNVYSTVGALQVDTTPSTYYNVDGKVYTGASGLAAVAAIAANTPIEAYGTLVSGGSSTKITPEITATQVYAGTVVANGQYEHVRGIVTAVSGTTLTVSNATYLYYEGYCLSNLCYTYFPTATINVGPSTLVTADNVASTAFSLFSVGTQVDAIGVGSQNSSGALTLDATNGLLRLQSTPIWGTLTSGAAGSATLNVLSMGNTGLPASDFNFTGTGTSSATDATVASYAVGTTAASATAPSIGPDLTAVTAGTLLRIDGFPTSFGAAPPDFNATAVTPGASEPADLIVEWSGSGATAPFTSQDSTSLALNLSNADLAEVVMGPQSDCSGTATAACIPLTGTPAITISGGNQFAIGNATAGISMFSTSSAFASALGSTLNGSTAVYRVVAIGTYDSASNTFAATRVDVALE
ncbi:MAG TPA: hypothetical protein VN735_03610 [Steroidobacteraceae bacterium]|nr:hypothetical protein [Steroidobacteraceae bacterium]